MAMKATATATGQPSRCTDHMAVSGRIIGLLYEAEDRVDVCVRVTREGRECNINFHAVWHG